MVKSRLVLLYNKKLVMNTADPQIHSEWRGCLRRRLVKQVQPSDEDKGLTNMIMMMMLGPPHQRGSVKYPIRIM